MTAPSPLLPPMRPLDELEIQGYRAALAELREHRRIIDQLLGLLDRQQTQIDLLVKIVASQGARTFICVEEDSDHEHEPADLRTP